MSRYLVWILGSGTLVAGSAVAVWLAMGMQDDRVAVAPDATPATPSVAPEPSTPPVAEEPPVVAPVPPGFGVVRVARDGAALVAGSAAPGAAVVLRVDGVERAQTSADSAGQFVAIFSLEPSDVPQVMTLEMLDAAGQVIVGEDTVILTPRPADMPVQIAAVDQPAADAVGQQTAVDGLPTTESQAEPLTALSDVATSGEAADPASAGAAAVQAQGVSEEAATEPAPVEVASALEAEPSAPPARDEPAAEVATDTPAPESLQSSPVAGTESASATPDDSAPGIDGQRIASDADQSTNDQPAAQAPVPGVPAADPAEAAPQEVASAEAATRPTGAAPSEAGADTPQAAQTAVASAEPAQADPVPVPDRTAPEAASEPTMVASAESAPESSRMPSAFLLRGDGQVTVLDRAPSVMDNVIIDSISYSSAGDVQIAGRAARANPDANLRIYLDNRPIAVAQAESGDWASDLPSIDPGVYTLRVDQVGTDGRVVSRFETPFQREAPEIVAAAQARAQQAAPVEQPVTRTAAVEPEASVATPGAARPVESAATTAPEASTSSTAAASVQESDAPAADVTPPVATPLVQETPEAAPAEPSLAVVATQTPGVTATAPASAPPTVAAPQVSLITVQPGNTLWHISRERYGEGERYVIIYNANRSQIRDPDLIYPGQIFTLPTE
ncbi:LysM peptidoglycan-binding domain-containing protein [Pararhodobacter zhoushanensis]|uniref:LysM peptidoglycan-binding domain-containing protein n=1 Tax=Pararhodobacter zhoushanensis TaxID=2479545 RepID=A0ABT3H135_9RHOB|nr:LysM peptidoglycan-binding domain-containing protein [Pararhodobacter zhoushanensis]MCW1933533.1 LysM peptidoglycan-binding domain-containing protein [Pararhodobacter zhoushanensis]